MEQDWIEVLTDPENIKLAYDITRGLVKGLVRVTSWLKQRKHKQEPDQSDAEK
jgi:hypothetical protein